MTTTTMTHDVDLSAAVWRPFDIIADPAFMEAHETLEALDEVLRIFSQRADPEGKVIIPATLLQKLTDWAYEARMGLRHVEHERRLLERAKQQTDDGTQLFG